MVFPNLAKMKVYSEAFKNLYEYIDIKNIIRKLQDIDKLKMVLLDEKQRNAFEMLPKPGIGKKKIRNSSLTMESIVRSRQTIFSKEKQNVSELLDGNPVNRRIYELLDPNLKGNLPGEILGKENKKIFVLKK